MSVRWLLGSTMAILSGCASEVSIEASDGVDSGDAGGGGSSDGAIDADSYCAARVGAMEIRLGCKHSSGILRSCVADVSHGERVGCTDVALALWDCIAESTVECGNLTTGCNREAQDYTQVCIVGPGEGGGEP